MATSKDNLVRSRPQTGGTPDAHSCGALLPAAWAQSKDLSINSSRKPSPSCSCAFVACTWLPTPSEPFQAGGPIEELPRPTTSTRRHARLRHYLMDGLPISDTFLAPGVKIAFQRQRLDNKSTSRHGCTASLSSVSVSPKTPPEEESSGKRHDTSTVDKPASLTAGFRSTNLNGLTTSNMMSRRR